MRSSSVQLLQLEQYYLQQQNSFKTNTAIQCTATKLFYNYSVIIVQPILTSLKSIAQLLHEIFGDKRLDSSRRGLPKEAQTAELSNQAIKNNAFI